MPRKKREVPKAFPIFINIVDKKCTIYGGGTIATRRANGLLRFGALVDVYSPTMSEALQDLTAQYPERLHLHYEKFKPGIPDSDFVFSCVDDRDADDAIYRECKERGIPVSIGSDQTRCDFFFPALVEGNDMVIGISSSGQDHQKVRRVASSLRDWIKVVEQAEEADCKQEGKY